LPDDLTLQHSGETPYSEEQRSEVEESQAGETGSSEDGEIVGQPATRRHHRFDLRAAPSQAFNRLSPQHPISPTCSDFSGHGIRQIFHVFPAVAFIKVK
jgi:hypothetical protein